MRGRFISNWFVRKSLIILAVAATLLGSGVFSYYWFLVRGPLAGDTSHDFGVVSITGEEAVVTHTFSLRNRTGHTLHIERIIPDCGCVQFEPKQASVEPGATIDLHATMYLYSDGKKTVAVRVILGDDGVQFLHVQATGRRDGSAPLTNATPSLPPQPAAPPTSTPAS